MRKVSKNRTDDDIISSTNGSGSVHNEENQDLEQSVENNEKESVSRNDDKSANDASNEEKKPDSSKKGKSKKTKSKKKKAIKTKKAEEDEEEYEVCNFIYYHLIIVFFCRMEYQKTKFDPSVWWLF